MQWKNIYMMITRLKIKNKINFNLHVLFCCSPIFKYVITKLLNSEQSYKGKVKTHKYINSQNQSTTGKLTLFCFVRLVYLHVLNLR